MSDQYNSSCSAGTPIYLDYNATTPLAPEVISNITKSLLEDWGNPSSSHSPGLRARRVVEEARRQVAETIGAAPDSVVFTSGGTEANNMVLLGCVQLYRSTGRAATPHVVTSDVEHDAVREPLEYLDRRGLVTVTWLSCADGGRVDPKVVLAAVTPDTCLVSIMMANNETGVLNDLQEIGRLLDTVPNREQFWFHTDSAQAVGKVKVDVHRLRVDFLTVVGHKLYGPRVGALYCSQRGRTARLGGDLCVTLLRGGGQENGLRPGTENTPLVRGLGTACHLVTLHGRRHRTRMRHLRDLLEDELLKSGVAQTINFRNCERLPNTCSAVLTGSCSAAAVLTLCRRLQASTGSACHELGSATASGVLLRSGLPLEVAHRTVRLSVGRDTSESEIVGAVADLCQALRRAAVADGQQK